MKIFKENPRAQIPTYATEGSACFDLRACLNLEGTRIRGYNPLNKAIDVPTKLISGKISIQLHPQYRMLIPTGLIFDIPKLSVLHVYPRSGIALKTGLTLVNCTGVIDSDYVEQVYISLLNVSDSLVIISDGDRLAQAMLVSAKQTTLIESSVRPEVKTDRIGGIGSTGTE